MGGLIKIIEFQELANWKVKGFRPCLRSDLLSTSQILSKY